MATAVGVTGMSVVYLYVGDMARSLAFYRDVLGIALDGDDRWAEVTFPGGTRFGLHETHEGVGELSSGTVHVDFTVDDADAAVERLKAHGVEVGEPMRAEWGTAVDVRDPDGYAIQLFQPPG